LVTLKLGINDERKMGGTTQIKTRSAQIAAINGERRASDETRFCTSQVGDEASNGEFMTRLVEGAISMRFRNTGQSPVARKRAS